MFVASAPVGVVAGQIRRGDELEWQLDLQRGARAKDGDRDEARRRFGDELE